MEGARVLPPLSRGSSRGSGGPSATPAFVPSDFVLAHPARSSSALKAAPSRLSTRARHIASQSPPLPGLRRHSDSSYDGRGRSAGGADATAEVEREGPRQREREAEGEKEARESVGVALLQRGLQGTQGEEAQSALRQAFELAREDHSQLKAVVSDQAGLADAYLNELAALVGG